jgi:hypothetical protein
MINPNYLLHRPGAPSAPKRFLDRQVIPLLIDAAGALETTVERMAIGVRQSPGRSMGIAMGAGMLLSFLLPRRAFLLPRRAFPVPRWRA